MPPTLAPLRTMAPTTSEGAALPRCRAAALPRRRAAAPPRRRAATLSCGRTAEGGAVTRSEPQGLSLNVDRMSDATPCGGVRRVTAERPRAEARGREVRDGFYLPSHFYTFILKLSGSRR